MFRRDEETDRALMRGDCRMKIWPRAEFADVKADRMGIWHVLFSMHSSYVFHSVHAACFLPHSRELCLGEAYGDDGRKHLGGAEGGLTSTGASLHLPLHCMRPSAAASRA